MPGPALGRYLEPALWVLVALDGDPLAMPALFDAVRRLDGPVRPGSFVAALARLERLQLVDWAYSAAGRRVYRLTILGRAAGRSAAILRGQPA